MPAAKGTRAGLYENRIRFARAIESEAPDVLRRLRDNVLPHWVPALYPTSTKRAVDLTAEVMSFSAAFKQWREGGRGI
jgi:hypothetical protein